METDTEDVEDPNTCETHHKYQYIELKDDGHVWQYFFNCGRELKVR